MQNPQQSNNNMIQTVVKLFGDPNDNINTILSTLDLSSSQQNNVKRVLIILYGKIAKLRAERNIFREQVKEKDNELWEIRIMKEKIEIELDQIKKQLDNMTAKPSVYQGGQYSFDQTPPMKQVYMSMQFGQNKQNKPLEFDQIKVSSFQSDQHELGGQVEALMKKYNLTVSEFKKVLLRYAQEQRKALEQLETDSQRQLYVQSKKTANYEEWLKRMSKKITKTKQINNMSSISSNLSHR